MGTPVLLRPTLRVRACSPRCLPYGSETEQEVFTVADIRGTTIDFVAVKRQPTLEWPVGLHRILGRMSYGQGNQCRPLEKEELERRRE